MPYAHIAIAVPLGNLFTYELPPDIAGTIRCGQLVEVPFGKRRQTGLVVSLSSTPPAEVQLKPIAKLLEPEPLVSASLLKVLLWAAEYYLVPPGEMIFTALPPVFRRHTRKRGAKNVRLARAVPGGDRTADRDPLRRSPVQARLLDRLRRSTEWNVAELCRGDPTARSALTALVKKGLVVIEQRATARSPIAPQMPSPPPIHSLTEAQTKALGPIEQAIGQRQFAAFLLHGVTGSGKTEIYLRAIARAVESGRGAILLVPEISLTPQLVARVRSRFSEHVAVLHSGLSGGERLDEWRRLQRGEALVAVGARSAVFAPIRDLALLVVDEEHDPSYKQSERLPYHARDLAILRGREEHAVVVLGSATPSLESMQHAYTGRYGLLTLGERVEQRPLPEIEVVDLKHITLHPDERDHTLSPRLAELLAQTLDRREQAILFLNRRGYSSFALCQDCGEAIRCDNCSVALVHHLKEQSLRCHYCGQILPIPTRCPRCTVGRVSLFGLGTEKVEAEVARRFPGIRIARLDSDAVAGRGVIEGIMSRFAHQEVDVVVGTQMVTKGHDIPNVTLVGVLLADLSLHLPDFRATERTFQLLTQVAGRSGRGIQGGRVVIQTFMPQHETIVLTREHRFDEFVRRELTRRKALGYPPFRRLLLIRLSHPEAAHGLRLARAIADVFRRGGSAALQVLGPAPAPLQRLRGRYRFQMLIKARGIEELHRLARLASTTVQLPSNARIIFDMDPQDML
jgi:primosomal protein N' (replication factor Y)